MTMTRRQFLACGIPYQAAMPAEVSAVAPAAMNCLLVIVIL
jgi:hypothetical protein